MSNFDPTSVAEMDLGTMDAEVSIDELLSTQLQDRAGSGTVTEEKITEGPKVISERAPALPVPSIPTPVPILKRALRGRYKGTYGPWQLELRVDVDGRRPTMRVSGDFYRVSGATTTYFGSFIATLPSVTVATNQVQILGSAKFTFQTPYTRIRVVIPRMSILQPPAPATITFVTPEGVAGSTYTCMFESPYFRRIQYEQDCTSGVTPFASYATGSLPSGGPARTLTVSSAFAEAGIELQTSGVWNVVPTTGIGPSWSNAELHAAMVTQFSLWRDDPQWKVWSLTADLHDLGPGLYGIMFDQMGRQRQGCAVFHRSLAGTSADKKRLQLFTAVHELGHCFNLLHSWQKSYATPPGTDDVRALSWMNYPWGYPDGAPAFWAAFPFQFSDPELIHLRHAYRNNIIMGGNPFGTGAALDDGEAFSDAVEDRSGLLFEIESKRMFALGEPVVVEFKLRGLDRRGVRVHKHLHPNLGYVQIAIQKPGGTLMAYEPSIEHCMAIETERLDDANPSIYDSAFIGYGKGGMYFDTPGLYKIRAVYHALDGSRIASNTLTLRVRAPITREDEEIAELLSGDEQGMLLYLLGSDSEALVNGNDALQMVLEKHAKHPLANYVRLVKGVNAAREFKRMTADKRVDVRAPQIEESRNMLRALADASETPAGGVDNITLNQALRSLGRGQKLAGDTEGAQATHDQIVKLFRRKNLKPHVQKLIERQAAEMLKA